MFLFFLPCEGAAHELELTYVKFGHHARFSFFNHNLFLRGVFLNLPVRSPANGFDQRLFDLLARCKDLGHQKSLCAVWRICHKYRSTSGVSTTTNRCQERTRPRAPKRRFEPLPPSLASCTRGTLLCQRDSQRAVAEPRPCCHESKALTQSMSMWCAAAPATAVFAMQEISSLTPE